MFLLSCYPAAKIRINNDTAYISLHFFVKSFKKLGLFIDNVTLDKNPKKIRQCKTLDVIYLYIYLYY